MHQAMRLAGKLGGRGGSMDTGPGSGPGCFHIAATDGNTAAHNHRLFFLRDNDSGRKFLIDTGSSFSILPYRSAAAVFRPRLRAANGHAIRCWGTVKSSVRIDKQVYQWLFIRADVRFPILGIDFLRNFDLLVDVAKERILARSQLQLPPAAGFFTCSCSQHSVAATGGTASSTAPPAATPAQPIKSAAIGGTASSRAPLSTAEWTELLAEFPSLMLKIIL
jgi:hypothetical protein